MVYIQHSEKNLTLESYKLVHLTYKLLLHYRGSAKSDYSTRYEVANLIKHLDFFFKNSKYPKNFHNSHWCLMCHNVVLVVIHVQMEYFATLNR